MKRRKTEWSYVKRLFRACFFIKPYDS